MPEYLKLEKSGNTPRLPLEGSLDLTYRCNNNCRHCWIRIPASSAERQEELTFDEIIEIVDEARKMGCRRWFISGGEPMLRPDFAEILDYITRKSVTYSLNTNGTLITPKIARLLRRKGSKMVALYGATAQVHDHITRHPGSFDATMRGFAYLKEADAGFIVQVVPMRDNYHQFDDMIHLAGSLSRHWRIGAAWLYLSACGDPQRNREIIRQRLDPKEVVDLDKPDLSFEEWMDKEDGHVYNDLRGDDRLFPSCVVKKRNEFHIDPYGQMTLCGSIRDPALRYSLREGSFGECWEEFIPSLADEVKGGKEYLKNCGSCELRDNCSWCAAYGYLEHRRLSAKVEYLCAVARERRRFKEKWKKNHRRHYQIAGITIQVESDLPIADTTFHPKFSSFRVDGQGEDNIIIRHHFALPDLDSVDLGKEIYRRSPWAIYRKGGSWIYTGIYSIL
jgi:MoaA/NifB/PqqE/SkfB family radical SAM enzyme